MAVVIESYVSPTLVLLAFDWPDGHQRHDFLGFAIPRTPGFGHEPTSWLPNRIGFNGPPANNQPDFPSDAAPIQKFYWWDARIDTKDRGSKFSYRVVPVVGTATAIALLEQQAGAVEVQVPEIEAHGSRTHVDRAVVSSQALSTHVH